MDAIADLGIGEREGPRGCGPLSVAESNLSRPIRQQIFEHVRAAGAISRAQIAKEIGVSPASVTTQTSELIEAGLLHEIPAPRDPEDIGRGRPPVALGVRPDSHLVAGIKLSDRRHTAVLLDFAGNERASATAEAAGIEPPDSLLDSTVRLVDAACAQAGLDRRALAQVGIGLPGFIDQARGQVRWSPIMTGGYENFAAAAAARLGVPTTIDNDANLVALAELWFGAGRSLSDFAVVTIEHGVGMGLVVDHRLYRGAQGLGLEIGHMKVQLDGALCRCGQRGCLEAYVADYALAREAAVALNRIGKPMLATSMLIESLFDQAKAGNAAARSIFRRAGRYLAVGLANVVNLFDPALIILSGERMRYDYLYAEDTLAEIGQFALQTGRGTPPIEVHAWGDLLWAYGAAALALSAVTDRLLGPVRVEAVA